MGDRGAHLRRGVLAILFAAAALAVVPGTWLPYQPETIAATEGAFAGGPVRLAAPDDETRAMVVAVEVSMREGTCAVGLRDADGTHVWGRAGEASWSGRIAAGDEIVLEPDGHAGRYDVSIRLAYSDWSPLGPKVRRFVLLPAVLAAALVTLFRSRVRRMQEGLRSRGLGPGHQLAVVMLVLLSGLVLYPAVHEAGHLLAGALFGGSVDLDRVVWTPIAGEEPHAAFEQLPESAVPWMSAGGTVLPVVVALVLLAVRRLLSGRAPWLVSTSLLVVAALFLFSTIGCLFELGRNTHLDALSTHLGLTGAARVVFSLGPLIVAATVLASGVRSWRRRSGARSAD